MVMFPLMCEYQVGMNKSLCVYLRGNDNTHEFLYTGMIVPMRVRTRGHDCAYARIHSWALLRPCLHTLSGMIDCVDVSTYVRACSRLCTRIGMIALMLGFTLGHDQEYVCKYGGHDYNFASTHALE